MSKKIVLATRNKGKIKELREMLAKYQVEVLGLDDFPQTPEVEEDGLTFEHNAIKKAQTISDYLMLPALADDSGVEVDALGGQPGVFSARFAGNHATDEQNNRKIIEAIRDIPESERSARFRCVLALAVPGKEVWTCDGVCEGVIITEPQGTNGFGYDPLFFLPKFGLTMAQLSSEGKNQISHRGKAVRNFIEHIHELI
ncbi:MAG TPA: XTP/dITP diphosphatase [Bacillota bacterium]|nr:XTP/dITP diphosphatase [Bacillota bacterium]